MGRRGARHPRPDGGPYDTRVVDERDLEIIAALQEDARATYADIGRRAGLSPSSIHERVIQDLAGRGPDAPPLQGALQISTWVPRGREEGLAG